ncbi:MAG: ISKra4 family transposase [Gammaproteobacteria bacterium]|jgi:hypothetical protein
MTSYPIGSATIEPHYIDACEQFDHLIGRLQHPDAQKLTHGEVEAVIHSEGMELLRRMTQGHLDQRSAQEPFREKVIGEDGLPRTHHRAGCKRGLESRFGEVTVTRRGYGARGLESVFPLDAELNLPPDKYSHGLRQGLADEVIRGSFDESVAHLKRLGGGQVSKRQSEELAVHLSQDFDAFYRQPLGRIDEDEGAARLLVITADGKGIVMHPNGLRAATRKAMEQETRKQRTRLSPGEKSNRKRMATVVSVYEIERYPRSPEQILDPEHNSEQKRPQPCHKRTWARVEEDLKAVIEQGFQEAMRRDPEQRLHWVVLTDGQEDLLRQVYAAAKRYQVEITVVQDFIHVLEYLWKAGHALYPEEPETREHWVENRAAAVLAGRASEVATGLRRAATRKQLSQHERKPVDCTANYIENNQQRLRYDQALDQGLPIATGVIEGACRHLVKDRMDITGARWGLQRAEAILKLRSLKISGDLPAYMEFHFNQEAKRNYPGPPIPVVFGEAA